MSALTPSMPGCLDGAYIVAGTTSSSSAGHYDVWLLKLDEQGNGPGPSSIPAFHDSSGEGVLLSSIHPHPMKEGANISCSTEGPALMSIAIVSTAGTVVKRMSREVQAAGRLSIHWNGMTDGGEAELSGVYLYRIDAGSRTGTGKILVVR